VSALELTPSLLQSVRTVCATGSIYNEDSSRRWSCNDTKVLLPVWFGGGAMWNEGTRRGDVRMQWRAGSLGDTRTLWLQLTQRAGTYDRRSRRGVPLDTWAGCMSLLWAVPPSMCPLLCPYWTRGGSKTQRRVCGCVLTCRERFAILATYIGASARESHVHRPFIDGSQMNER
jgi:hypothetical protein